MKRVFVCHPFAGDPEGNSQRVAEICSRLAADNFLPVAPQLYLPWFLNEPTQRDLALRLCLELVRISDEIRVYGIPTAGMHLEIAEAYRLGIPIVEGRIE